jgi:hypothetical protein
MCFANSLSPQSWMNIHPSIKDRIFELNPTLLQDLQLENLRKLRNRPLFSLFRSLEEELTDMTVPGVHLSLYLYLDCHPLVCLK